MRTVTFLVLDGVDKGRVFRDLSVPVTIGREEGNALRLNDERVSRYHAKVQAEEDDIILTDLDSTNGTRVNGSTIQIRRLRPGDQVSIGRTMLLFGTMEEIDHRRQCDSGAQPAEGGAQTIRSDELKAASGQTAAANAIRPTLEAATPVEWSARERDMPPLPLKLSGSQAARLTEILDYLHRGITQACESIEANEDGTEIKLGFDEWQTVQAVQMLLARYSRMVAEPESIE
ncbi:MAG: FHA domain-containing protein [Bacteroidales bacterium]|nr:FHA domain-containing protein [Bacteroidales bacterium]